MGYELQKTPAINDNPPDAGVLPFFSTQLKSNKII
jgi:hypothetical protein